MSVNSKMTAIADAIRAKTGGTGTLTLDQMATDIAAIDTSEDLDAVLAEQAELIADIKTALEGKAAGNITAEDLTPELLTSLDPDFTADNIAEGVDLFGLVGTLSSVKMATGTVTTASKQVSVQGLDFQPNKVIMVSSTGNGVIATNNAIGYAQYGTDIIRNSYSLTFSGNGFTYKDNTAYYEYFSGAYTYVAWIG